MNNELGEGDLERTYIGLVYVLSRHLPGRSEEIHDSWRCLIRFWKVTAAILTELLCGFRQSREENVGLLCRLGRDHFLLNPFRSIINESSHQSTLYDQSKLMISRCSLCIPLSLLDSGSVKFPLSLLGNFSVTIPLSLLGNGSVKIPYRC
jgi:hypothetical protein